MLSQILENRSIENLVRNFSRSPLQQNRLHESDAELIHFPGTDITLAITMDSIVEEIEAGLYNDPYLIGWMTVMVNASDLAAVGATPLGMVINETFLLDSREDFIDKLQRGIEDACSECNMNILGGDTNFSSRMEMTGCAIGYISGKPPLTRLGAKPGDYLFLSGNPGLGNAFALKRFSGETLEEHSAPVYQPKSRLDEGHLLLDFATCCMDTSDGVFATLDQLMRLNTVGLKIDIPAEEFIHHEALSICKSAQFPAWLMLAGYHGEFELVFTVSPDNIDRFMVSAQQTGWAPVLIGKICQDPRIRFVYDEQIVSINTAKLRNLFSELRGDVQLYIAQLLELDKTIKGGHHESH